MFVTMNRRETARTCLERLNAQSLAPALVLVIDNASTDDTAGMIAGFRRDQPHFPLQYERLAENIGNAGGMEIGIAKAFAAGCDAVWILDDDSWPEPDALRALATADLPGDVVRSALVLDLTNGKLSWPLQVPDAAPGRWRIVEQDEELPSAKILRIRRAWLGALLPKLIYDMVGPVEGRLFLRGEDEDYPRRIENAGFKVHLIADSILHHPAAGALHRARFFGREIILERELPLNSLYYRLRNSWWLAKRDRGCFAALGIAAVHFRLLMGEDRSPAAWAPVWWEALGDAFSNRLGKRTDG